jgi:hypothetical protein
VSFDDSVYIPTLIVIQSVYRSVLQPFVITQFVSPVLLDDTPTDFDVYSCK